MMAIAAYESVEDEWTAGDVCQALSSLISLFPRLDKAYVSLPGGGAEQVMPLEGFQSFLTGHTGHFAASLLWSGGIRTDDHSLSSVPMITIQNLSEVRGLYLVFEPSALKVLAGPLNRCFDGLGEGFGYIAGANPGSSALDYALDIDVLTDLDQIEALLQPREGWRERLQSPSRRSQARNLYPINIWPKGFVRALQKEKCFTSALAAGEILSLGEYENIDMFFAEPGASAALAPLNDRLFFENLSDMQLRWLDRSLAAEVRTAFSQERAAGDP